jgi:hypothetical protein
MPYIAPEPNRAEIDPQLTDELCKSIQNVGDLNYVVTRLSLRLLMNQGVCYENISNILGTLGLIPAEMQRRFISDYENLKIEQNGDVLEYSEILQWLREKRQENYDHAPDVHQPHG